LLVDDDAHLLHGLARVLRHQPYQIYTARSGEEALMVLKGRPVDVIVSDEQMPGMRGGELLAWVAEHCPEVVRIVLTGRPTVENLIQAINEGAVYQFFTKPCDTLMLGAAIRKALEHKALVQENRRLLDANREQMRELQRHRQNLELLTAVVSHDVRQPLQTVACHCRMLSEQYRDLFDPKTASLVETALEGIGEAQRLLARLMERHRDEGPAGAAPAECSAVLPNPRLAPAPQ